MKDGRIGLQEETPTELFYSKATKRFDQETKLKEEKPILCPWTTLDLFDISKSTLKGWMVSLCNLEFVQTHNHLKKGSSRKLDLMECYLVWLTDWVGSGRPPIEIMNPNYIAPPEGGFLFCHLPSDMLFGCLSHLESFTNFGQLAFVCKRLAATLQDGRCWEPIYKKVNPSVSPEQIGKYQGDFRVMFFETLYSLGTPIRTRHGSNLLIVAIENYLKPTAKDKKRLMKLLMTGIDPNFGGSRSFPILAAASSWGKEDRVEEVLWLLLEYGADPIPFLNDGRVRDIYKDVFRSPLGYWNHENPMEGSYTLGWKRLKERLF